MAPVVTSIVPPLEVYAIFQDKTGRNDKLKTRIRGFRPNEVVIGKGRTRVFGSQDT